MALAEVRPREAGEAVHASGLGALLRQARERLGVSLDRVSNETKIPKRHLEALERDNLAVVPGGIYLRAEVRVYARAVQVDEGLALARLEQLLNPPAAAGETRVGVRSSEADRRTAALAVIQPWIPLAVLALAALVAALSWWPAVQRDDVRLRDSPAPSGELDLTARSTTRVATAVVSRDATEVAREPSAVTPEASPASLLPPVVPSPARPVSAPAPPGDTLRPVVKNRDAQPVEPPRAADVAPEPKGGITELVIATQPPGARVTVNGISWGVSPVEIRHLPPGAKRIRVSLDGYVSAERSITLAAGRRQRIEVRLRGR